MPTCVAFNCKSGYASDHTPAHVSFHSFLKATTQRPLLKEWVKRLCREDWWPSEHSMLCSKHFRPEDFKDDAPGGKERKYRKLKEGAVPTIFNIPTYLNKPPPAERPTTSALSSRRRQNESDQLASCLLFWVTLIPIGTVESGDAQASPRSVPPTKLKLKKPSDLAFSIVIKSYAVFCIISNDGDLKGQFMSCSVNQRTLFCLIMDTLIRDDDYIEQLTDLDFTADTLYCAAGHGHIASLITRTFNTLASHYVRELSSDVAKRTEAERKTVR